MYLRREVPLNRIANAEIGLLVGGLPVSSLWEARNQRKPQRQGALMADAPRTLGRTYKDVEKASGYNRCAQNWIGMIGCAKW